MTENLATVPSSAWLIAAACGAAVVALLIAIARGARAAEWAAKPTASALFIATAWSSGAGQSPYGRLILVGLALSLLGDVLLIVRGNSTAFKLGAIAFLSAHVFYAIAFMGLELDIVAAIVVAVAVCVPAILVEARLRGSLRGGMRYLVLAYMLVISIMVITAAGASVGSGLPIVLLGAFLFYLSDLFVARERFLVSAPINRFVGLPLYYAGQITLALSCSAVA